MTIKYWNKQLECMEQLENVDEVRFTESAGVEFYYLINNDLTIKKVKKSEICIMAITNSPL